MILCEISIISTQVEYHHLLKKSRRFLGEANTIQRAETEVRAGMLDPSEGIALSPLAGDNERGGYQQADDMVFSNIAGTINSSDKFRFERMLYRATRGNCYVRFAALSKRALDANGQHIDKVCFIIFYKSVTIEQKIKKICDAFSSNRYDLSNLSRPAELEAQQNQNQKELLESKSVIDKNTESRLRICVDVAASLEEWLWIVRREKGIYHTLNLFKNDVAGNLLRGRGWILSESVTKARGALKRAQINLNIVPTAMLEVVTDSWPTPPTHFQTNKYTYAFQEFVNTYGVPRYREANPALFTAATFPFLFGVMYGDIGHGSVLAIAGLYLIFTESRAGQRGMDEMLNGIYSARYMLFAMGLFAIYAGFIYNDFFSIGLLLGRSNYAFNDQTDGAPATQLSKYGDSGAVYHFGVDPAWKLSGNELLFYNSMKMKMSVILGIFQMTCGILLRGINAWYFRSTLDLLTEFLPMILFCLSLFGYMVVLIFVKWSINWDNRMALGSCRYDESGVLGACTLSDDVTTCYNVNGVPCDKNTLLADVCPLDYGGTGDGCQPPNLITTLINIALQPGTVDEPMYAGQAGVQTFLLLVAFICVPWLLFVKPFYLRHQHNSQKHNEDKSNPVENPLLGGHDEEGGHAVAAGGGHGAGHGGGHGDHGHGGEFNFGEIFIHQAIETIEFVLGMVSNTASYLRLWALSLAHTELALVFWEKAMISSIETNNPVAIFIGYAIFAAVTFGVLLAMDVLECFLHALRLHWVEFQNKFYKADGYRFQPFDFKAILGKALLE
ncbi:V-type ATPase 116kDa subunit family protein [archaeon]|nr:MAG: V-type ATPase 116kDa subunit family protein [archaeon]